MAIVGAGIGGLTLALALHARGISCQVFEQAADFTEKGTGIQISPNAVGLLRRLDLEDGLGRVAVRPEWLEILDGSSGRPIVRLVLGDTCEERFGAPLWTLRREALHDALRQAVTPGTVVTGARLTRLSTAEERVLLSFDDGSVHEADVVVGADGLHSAVRAQLVGDAPVFAGEAVYRGICAAGDTQLLGSAIRIWTGKDRHCVAYPVTPDGAVSFTALVAAEPDDGAPQPPGQARRGLLDAYREWSREACDLFEAAASVRRWDLYDRSPIGTWVSSRVALLGDAAHPMLPVLAQGANAAVEDAFTLAACLAESWPEGIAHGLRRYQSLRVPRASRLQAEARAQLESQTRPRRGAGQARGSYLDRQAWIFGYDAQAAIRESAVVGSG